jgi:DNA ligase-1
LITGTFRASASRAAVEQALADTSHVPQSIIARRLAESWEPTATAFLALMSPDQAVNEGGSVSARSVAPPAEDAEVPEHVPRAHFAVNAVLIYAQPGKSRGSSVSTEYTFGVWAAGELVPIAKLPLESPEATERRIASFVRQNTLQRFGPVRTVAPVIVAELAFEAVSPSARHKSGLVLRSPKVMRIRDDKRAEEADSLDALTSLIGT